MSGSVDDRVVGLRFDNSRFSSGVSAALGLLDRLKRSLNFGNQKNGLDNLQTSANRFNLGGVRGALDGVSNKFLALSTIGITALATITNNAITAGARMVKALTLDPVIGGFKEYEQGLNSVQTILANTQASGATLKDVNAALLQLNRYADKTIYNFGEMTKNIGTFTAAGVDLDTAVGSIKGIANLAALSGSNSEQASTAMYQLSQAISAGRVSLQDWNSVVNAGMGGTVFQRALAQTAAAMGTLDKGAVKLTGKMKNVTINGKSFRESITAKPGEKSWLTSKVLTNTLEQFTGDLSKAKLAAMGFNDQQIKAIQAQAKTANDAATKVKTFTQLMDTLKEAVGSGWAQSFQIIFGNFNEAKTLFTDISNVLGGIVNRSANARNKVLGDWKKLGGRTALIAAVKNIFEGLASVVKPIRQAFRDIFPAMTGKRLFELTSRLKEFTAGLKIGGTTADNLRRTFRGVFAIFSIIGKVVRGVFSVFGQLFGALSSGNGNLLAFTGNIGDMLVAFNKSLEEGGALEKFFSGLGAVLAVPIRIITVLRDAFFSLFDGADTDKLDGVSQSFSNLGEGLKNATGPGSALINVWEKIKDVFSNIKEALQPAIDGIGDAFSNLGDTISQAIASGNFGSVVDVLQTGLLGAIALALKKFASNGLSVDIGGGVLGKIGEAFEGLTGSMKAMQAQIKANTLLKIGIAIGILVASLVVLASIDPKKLQKAFTALAIAFGQLIAAMALLTKVTSTAGFVKIPIIAGSLILLSTAVFLLTASVKVLASMSWDELKRGLIGVGALLGGIAVAANILSANSAGLIRAGAGILVLSAALYILAKAVKAFAAMDIGTVFKGLLNIGGALVTIGLAMRAMPPNMVASAVAIGVLALALKVLATSIMTFANLGLVNVGKGLLGIAGSLVAIGVAMRAMPKGMILQAVALNVLAVALRGIAKAVGLMGGMDLKTLAKGLGTLAISLGILAGALNAMRGTIGGAAALVLASGALFMLSKVLVTLGALSLKQLGMGLLAIAGAFGVLGLAALVLQPLIPALLGLNIALLAFGAAIALVGVGVLGIGKGLGYLAANGSKGIAVLGKAISDFIAKIPDLLVALAKGLVGAVKTIASAAPGFVASFAKILVALLDGVIKVIPKIAELIGKLVNTFLKVLVQNGPKIISAGFKLFLNLLTGLAKNLPAIVTAAANVVIAFLKGLGENIARIIQAGIDFIIKFLEGIATGIEKNTWRVVGAVLNIAWAIIKTLGGGIIKGIGWILGRIGALFSWIWGRMKNLVSRGPSIGWQIIKKIGSAIWNGIKWLGGVIARFFVWLWGRFKAFVNSGVNIGWMIVKKIGSAIWNGIKWLGGVIGGFFGWLWGKMKSLVVSGANIGWNIIKKIGNGIWSGLKWLGGKIGEFFSWLWRKFTGALGKAAEIGMNILKGIWNGIKDGASWLWDKITGFLSDLWDSITDFFDILSPSKKFAWLSKMLILGMGKGFVDHGQIGIDAATDMSQSVLDAVNDNFSKIPMAMDSMNLDPTIRPMLDLSNVEKNASKLNDMLADQSINANVTAAQASAISALRTTPVSESSTEKTADTQPRDIKYIQNNYSPKALSNVEIYKQTRNQLSMAKEALKA